VTGGEVTFVSGYSNDLAVDVADFFEGWPRPPSAEVFREALRGSYATEFALSGGRVVGFVNAISDGVAAGFIPWLEVVPRLRGRGVGTTLMRRILHSLRHLYSIDLLCDPPLIAYYRRFGLDEMPGMGLRAPGNLVGAND
jgi:ribosomal protein S18 acetylase RimI-like enzyme